MPGHMSHDLLVHHERHGFVSAGNGSELSSNVLPPEIKSDCSSSSKQAFYLPSLFILV